MLKRFPRIQESKREPASIRLMTRQYAVDVRAKIKDGCDLAIGKEDPVCEEEVGYYKGLVNAAAGILIFTIYTSLDYLCFEMSAKTILTAN